MSSRDLTLPSTCYCTSCSVPLSRADLSAFAHCCSYAACSPEIIEKGYNGAYFSDPGTLGGETEQGQDMGLAKNLWELSEKLVKEKAGDDALVSWSA